MLLGITVLQASSHDFVLVLGDVECFGGIELFSLFSGGFTLCGNIYR